MKSAVVMLQADPKQVTESVAVGTLTSDYLLVSVYLSEYSARQVNATESLILSLRHTSNLQSDYLFLFRSVMV